MSGKRVDPDEMPHSVASYLGLHCLLRPVCPNTYGKYCTYIFFQPVIFFSESFLDVLGRCFLMHTGNILGKVRMKFQR